MFSAHGVAGHGHGARTADTCHVDLRDFFTCINIMIYDSYMIIVLYIYILYIWYKCITAKPARITIFRSTVDIIRW